MSKNALPYYKAYPRDFIEGTIGMTFEEKGAYRLLLDLIYMKAGALVDDDRYIAGVMNLSPRKWSSIKKRLVELDKIQIIDGLLSNYRAIIELENLSKFQDKQAEIRSRPNKNNNLQSPKVHQPEPEPDIKELSKDSSKKPQKRKTKIPDEWRDNPQSILTDKNLATATKIGMSQQEAQNEARKFSDYWTAEGTTKLEWDRVWSSWCGNWATYGGRFKGGFQKAGGDAKQGGNAKSSIADVVAQRQRSREQELENGARVINGDFTSNGESFRREFETIEGAIVKN